MFMARAATSTSGTKTSLFLNFSPMTLIPLRRPSLRICSTGIPSSIACCTSCLTILALPFCRFSEMSFRMLIVLSPFPIQNAGSRPFVFNIVLCPEKTLYKTNLFGIILHSFLTLHFLRSTMKADSPWGARLRQDGEKGRAARHKAAGIKPGQGRHETGTKPGQDRGQARFKAPGTGKGGGLHAGGSV